MYSQDEQLFYCFALCEPSFLIRRTGAHRTLQAELTIWANLVLETMENNMSRLQLTNNTIT